MYQGPDTVSAKVGENTDVHRHSIFRVYNTENTNSLFFKAHFITNPLIINH